MGSGCVIIEYLQLPMLGSESRYRQTERAGSYKPRMCCSSRLCRIGPPPPAKAFPGEWMFFSYEDDFGSLHFDEHPSILLFFFFFVSLHAAPLHCSRNVPKTQRQSEHLITHSAGLSHIILTTVSIEWTTWRESACWLAAPMPNSETREHLRGRATAEISPHQNRVWQVLLHRPWWDGS